MGAEHAHRMHRIPTALAAAAVLLGAAACSSGSHTASSAPTTAASSAPATASAQPTCKTSRDVIVRYVTPGQPATAQVLGEYNAGTCASTFQDLQTTSPTDPGYCTQAAWASDNPGYNADATPAAPLKHVQVSIGPAC